MLTTITVTISKAILAAGYWNLGCMVGEKIADTINKVEEHVKTHIDDIKENSKYNNKKEAN